MLRLFQKVYYKFSFGKWRLNLRFSFGRCLGVSNRLLQSLHMNVLIGLLRRRLASTVRSSIKNLSITNNTLYFSQLKSPQYELHI